MKIQIINGPNLNLLGVREPGIYGDSSFEAYLPKLRAAFPGVEIDYYQSNIEGELIDKMQEVGFSADGIVLNAGRTPTQASHCKTASGRSGAPWSRCTSPTFTSAKSSGTTPTYRASAPG